MRALFHYAASPGLADHLAGLDGAAPKVSICPEADDALLFRLLPETDVLWHVLKPATAQVLDAAPRLRLVQKWGVGVNTIDLERCKALGIAVCNMPGSNTTAVAEAALALMLAALRRIGPFDRAMRAGRGWAFQPQDFDRVGEVAGRTVGIVGYGAVGQRLAGAVAGLGARVLYTARSRKPGALGEWRDLDALLAQADIVSLHLPLTPETAKLLSAERIGRMKPGAILVNAARGGLVDEPALVAALRSGQLMAAGLDVFAEEPVDPANPLLALDNVVLLPHIAWLTPETLARSLVIALENCRRLAAGEALLHRVV
ncbi:MAG: hydroxyacid dehydrogenase [Alphaproteobacteria bacterium]|nr:hydroxyacid dehydrogenase [Alphaproteobacteria bacterium]